MAVSKEGRPRMDKLPSHLERLGIMVRGVAPKKKVK
jgi:hypothetical protein